MQDITELEKRITAALERIGKGVDRLGRPCSPAVPPAQAAAGGDAALRAQLEEEKVADRPASGPPSRRQGAEAKGDLQEKLDRLTQELGREGPGTCSGCAASTPALREQLEALRTAAAAGVTEPHLINKAMATELEALRATRLTEIAEMDEILAALEPHLTEAGNA
jgi:hypothetical protein